MTKQAFTSLWVASKSPAMDYSNPPGCAVPNSNGVKVPHFIRTQIAVQDLDPSCLINWDQAREQAVATFNKYKA